MTSVNLKHTDFKLVLGKLPDKTVNLLSMENKQLSVFKDENGTKQSLIVHN